MWKEHLFPYFCPHILRQTLLFCLLNSYLAFFSKKYMVSRVERMSCDPNEANLRQSEYDDNDLPKEWRFLFEGKLEPLDQPWGSLLPDLLWEIIKPPLIWPFWNEYSDSCNHTDSNLSKQNFLTRMGFHIKDIYSLLIYYHLISDTSLNDPNQINRNLPWHIPEELLLITPKSWKKMFS